jgi:hypothetical protein
MSDQIDELIAALAGVAEIVANPADWKKRAQDNIAAAEKSSKDRQAAQQLHDAAESNRRAAAADLETARQERGQAEFAKREAASHEQSVKQREDAVTKREQTASDRERHLAADKANHDAWLAKAKADLAAREKAVEEKLIATQALLKNYDEAKHKAALKLAS